MVNLFQDKTIAPRNMKSLKLNLIILGSFVFMSLFVIGTFRFSSITYPAILIIIATSIYKFLQSNSPTITKVIAGAAGIVCLYYLAIFIFQFSLCGYGPRQDKYINIKHANLKIVGRDFSYFGTTGDLILYKHYSFSDKIGLELYYKTFPDYRNVHIDNTIWRPVTN